MKLLLGFVGVGLLIYAVIDCSRTPDAEVPASLSRSGWLVLIILLPFLGPLFWLVASRTDVPGGPGGRPGPSRTATRKGPPPRTAPPRGPDDDPDFLRGL